MENPVEPVFLDELVGGYEMKWYAVEECRIYIAAWSRALKG